MTRLARRVACAFAAALATSTLSLTALTPVATADQPDGYGPSDPFDDSIMPNDGPQPSVRHEAKIVRTAYGYRLIAAEQNSHLRLKVVGDRLRFRDTRVASWKSLPKTCTNQRVSPGVAASCRIPDGTSLQNPSLIEIRPRLGNDTVDGRGLPASLEMAVLGDAGRDTLFGGRGNDYLGGASDRDRAYGGAGRDWMRGGSGADRLRGGDDSDWVVGLAGRDSVDGGAGKDNTRQ